METGGYAVPSSVEQSFADRVKSNSEEETDMRRMFVMVLVVLSVMAFAGVASAERDNIGGIGTTSVKAGKLR